MKILELVLFIPAVLLLAGAVVSMVRFMLLHKKAPLLKKISVGFLGPFALGKSQLLNQKEKTHLRAFYLFAAVFVLYLVFLLAIASS